MTLTIPSAPNTPSSHPIDLLRFSTAGSVDDGKSTLIGRLLLDTDSIFEDQYLAIQKTSERKPGHGGAVDLALLTDGLKAEREQGITIDVAYRYFSTEKRKFIIADTPGHEQYTRNMITGASTANLAIVLVDARKGMLDQSRRHAIISNLLRIPHLVVCINKMDLVDYSQGVFDTIVSDFKQFAKTLSFKDTRFIPVSALLGDNIVQKSAKMSWYTGPALLEFLETVEIADDYNREDARFPVQYVIRPNLDYRGYAGQVASGSFSVGQEVIALPSGKRSRIKSIDTFDGPLQTAFYPLSVTVALEDEIDISRGDMLVGIENAPRVDNNLRTMLSWMSETPLELNKKYLIKHTSHTTKAMVKQIAYRLNINTLNHEPSETLRLNEIAEVDIKTLKPLFHDDYATNRNTGSFILIDELTHQTVAAGMIV